MNLNEALGFSVPGAYLDGKTINPQYKRRFWFWWYAIALAIGVLGLSLVLFGTPMPAARAGRYRRVVSITSPHAIGIQAADAQRETAGPLPSGVGGWRAGRVEGVSRGRASITSLHVIRCRDRASPTPGKSGESCLTNPLR